MPEATGSEFGFELTTGHIEKATKQSAAFDLFYNGNVPMWIGDSPVKVPTGVRSKFSPNLVAVIKEKSGLANKGIEVKGGVIDADYRDEWMVILRNPVAYPVIQDELSIPSMPLVPIKDWKPFKLEPGMKIAQFMMMLLPDVHFFAMPSATISILEDERTGGFGSTGDRKATS
jgi:dUTPase